MSSSYRIALERWLAQLDIKAEKVLDIGGSQLPVKGRTRSWEVSTYLIADLPEPHIESPKPDFEIDLNEAPSSAKLAGANFCDLIFCLEVFEYIWNPANALENISLLLKKGGAAWVSFPSHYPLHQPVADDALRYMPSGIRKLADSVGLTIRQMIPRRTETDAIHRAFLVERMRCAKGEDHNISGWIVQFER